jgi:DNA-binding IclR family transcriptional regulator
MSEPYAPYGHRANPYGTATGVELLAFEDPAQIEEQFAPETRSEATILNRLPRKHPK